MIAIFSISDKLGGAEQVLYKIAKYYSDKDYKVKIYFIKRSSNFYWKDTLVNSVDLIYLSNDFLKLIRLLKNEQFRFVFSSHIFLNALLGVFRCFGILKTQKFIARESTQIFGRYTGLKLLIYKFAYWIGYRKIDLLICQTNKMLETLKKSTPYLTNRINLKIIPNPFDFPNKDLINEKICQNNRFIVAAGRLIPEKGFDVLIKSFSYLIVYHTDIKLLILGEGPERKKLEKLVSELGLINNVILMGHVDNVYPYFRNATVCVVSSIKEGFPNVLLQMMSQNVSVVSTLCAGGIGELKGVRTCAVNDSLQLFKAINGEIITSNSKNRLLFDQELSSRSIRTFIEKIETSLNNN